MEPIQSFFSIALEGSVYQIPSHFSCAVFAVILAVLFNDKFKVWRPLYATLPVFGTGLSLMGFCLCVPNFPNWGGVAGVLLVLPWVFCCAIYGWNCLLFRNYSKRSDIKSLEHDDVAALNQLYAIPLENLTRRQKQKWNRSRITMLVKLGSLNTASQLVEEFQNDKVFYYFVKHMIAHLSGDMVKAKEYSKQTEANITNKTSKQMITQIQLNHGVSYVTMDQKILAEVYFQKAAATYRTAKLKDPEILYNIYYNWTFHKTRLLSEPEAKSAVDVLLADYETLIDPHSLLDKLYFSNLKLDMMRQFSIDKDILAAYTNESFTSLVQEDSPIANKCMLAASTARMVWAGQLIAEPCLSFLQGHADTISQLPPHARYRIYKELYALFTSSGISDDSKFTHLKEQVLQYFPTEAEKDLCSWLDSLPSEAINARCQCLKEQAGLQRQKPDYTREKAASYMQNILHLYRENGHYAEECATRLDLVDELCAPENLDQNFRPIMQEEMRSQLAEVDKFLPMMVGNPALVISHIRAGFYYFLLDDYEKCLFHYEKYRASTLSLDHFTPYIHNYSLILSVIAKVLYFCKAIQDIAACQQSQLNRMDPPVRDWFNTFPHHEGTMDAFLLGTFLGCPTTVPAKRKMWFPADGLSTPQSHTWLFMPGLALDIDISFSQFETESQPHRMFFHMDRHPFETGESETILNSIHATGAVIALMEKSLSPEDFTTEDLTVCNQILELIHRSLAQNCPTKQEINLLYQKATPVTSSFSENKEHSHETIS